MEKHLFVYFSRNAPAHQSVLVKDFLTKTNDTTLEHPPYSSDMSSADLFFPSTVISTAMTALL
jgi:transposase